VYQGKRIQESTGCSTKTAAKAWEQNRKRELERAHAGLPSEQRPNRIKTVAEIIEPYLSIYALTHRESSTAFAQTKLRNVGRLLGSVLLSDLNEDRVWQYIRERQADGVSGRTVNMELGELSRAIGQPWSILWPKIRKLEERKDVGRALSAEDQNRILDAASVLRSQVLRSIIPLLLLTGMRSGEAMSLRWHQIDFFERTITVAARRRPVARVEPYRSTTNSRMSWQRIRHGSFRISAN
jgi:integrase